MAKARQLERDELMKQRAETEAYEAVAITPVGCFFISRGCCNQSGYFSDNSPFLLVGWLGDNGEFKKDLGASCTKVLHVFLP